MRINKSTESSSFDEYLKIMSSFNKKKSFLSFDFFKKASAAGIVFDAITPMKRLLDDVVQIGVTTGPDTGSLYGRIISGVKPIGKEAADKLVTSYKMTDDHIRYFFGSSENMEEFFEALSISQMLRDPSINVHEKALLEGAFRKYNSLSSKIDADKISFFYKKIKDPNYNFARESVDALDREFRTKGLLEETARTVDDIPSATDEGLEEASGIRDTPEPEGTRPGDAPEPEGTRPGDAPEPEGTRPGDAPEPEGTRPGDAPGPEVPPASTDEVVREGEEVVRSLDEVGDGVEVTDDALREIKEEIANYMNKTEAKIAELTSKLDNALENGDAKAIGELSDLVEKQADVLGGLDKKLKALENSKGSLSSAQKAEIEELIKNSVKTAEKAEDTAGGIIAALAKADSRASRVAGGLMTAVKYSLTIAAGVLAAPYVMGMFGGGDDGSSGDIPPEQGGQGGISDRRRPLSWRERQRQNEGPVFKAIREASKNNNMAELNALIESAATNEKYKEYITEEIFGRKAMIILPREFLGMRYAFINPTGGDVGKNPELLGDMVLRSLRRMDLGGKQYNAAKRTDGPEAQRILNKAATVILQADLVPGGLFPGAKGRADKALFGDPVETTRRSQRRSEKRSRKSLRDRFEQESLSEPLRMAAKENRSRSIDQIRKESSLKIKEFYELSTNNKHKSDISLDKRADEISKSYHKDAVKDLREQDKTLRDYFAGLGRLYEEESEKRKPDQKELYELHDETGSDLTLSAHPNAIRLSDAMGDGGLVENGLEQKSKMEGVALRTPTGNFQSRYANLKYLLQKASK